MTHWRISLVLYLAVFVLVKSKFDHAVARQSIAVILITYQFNLATNENLLLICV